MSLHTSKLQMPALLATLVVVHLLLFFNLPHTLQAIAALTLTAVIPGLLLVDALVGRSKAAPTLWERLLYSMGAGYGMAILGMLGLSFLPGALLRWQSLAFFDALIVVLALFVWRRSREPVDPDGNPRTVPASHAAAGVAAQSSDGTGRDHNRPTRDDFPDADLDLRQRPWLLAGILSLLLVGAFFRFTNLGYAEFQGDEARAALRAAAILQGYEDVLLIHKKGPTEILLPTAIYSLTGHLTEATARLPFALANLAALFAVYLLGWRLFNARVGWIAGLFFALDGYFIGFSRIVQYQSVVFLTSILVVLILYRLLRRPDALTPYLTLASILLATGLLSHYEAALVVVPAAFLLGMIYWRNRARWREISLSTLIGGSVGVAMLACFYVPFILHPHFQATYTYLTDRRIGGSFPYNNLADFFLRTTVYSTTYYVVLLIVLTAAALVRAYGRGLGNIWGAIAACWLTATLAISFWQPALLTVGAVDLTVTLFALPLAAVLLLPNMRAGERMLWLWFGVGFLLAIFFTEKPRTHVYTFFMPWLLLAGLGANIVWEGLRAKVGQQRAGLIGATAAALLVLFFGAYAYWYFVHNRTEVLRTWDAWHPAGYWTAYAEPDDRALFGFPLANGWKVVAQLYAEGVLSGSYETNEKEAWVPAWYTRGADRCARTADWFFEIDNLESWNMGDQRQMEHFLRHGFEKWGVVEVNNAPRLTIYQRTGAELALPNAAPIDELPRFPLEAYAPAFDAASTPDLPLTYPAVNNEIEHPLHVNFDNQIWLEGYNIDHPHPLRQGDTIELTLFWRAQQPITASYKIFNQSYFGDGVIVAQRDGYPVCESRETWRWDPGELITDVYRIPVKADAPDGLYPLYSGLYLEESFERLPVLDEDGQTVGTQWHVTDIRIGEE